MSGDVQPRKRRDRKKKRDGLERKSEAEIVFTRKSSLEDDESSHGVHATKMGSDDVHLHVQHDHGTGGHWCAKIIFFFLMAILLGVVGMIIMENRGSTDLDTPLSESRFSNYFNGWVEEHRPAEHDDHGTTEEAATHDHDDEHDEEHHDDHEDDADDHDDDHHDDDDDKATDSLPKIVETVEKSHEDHDDEDDADVDDDVLENVVINDDEDDNNLKTSNPGRSAQQQHHLNDEDDDDDDDVEDDIKAYNDNEYDDDEDTSKALNDLDGDDDEDDDDDDDDDNDDDELNSFVDNDAAEYQLLQERARQQAEAEAKLNPSAKNQHHQQQDNDDDDDDVITAWMSSLAIRIGIGLTLALVAHIVLFRKATRASSNEGDDVKELSPQYRRLTVCSSETEILSKILPAENRTAIVNYPAIIQNEKPHEVVPLNDDVMNVNAEDLEEEIIEIEEEIEYLDDGNGAEEGDIIKGDECATEAFKEMQTLYKNKLNELEMDEDKLHDIKEEEIVLTGSTSDSKHISKNNDYLYEKPNEEEDQQFDGLRKDIVVELSENTSVPSEEASKSTSGAQIEYLAMSNKQKSSNEQYDEDDIYDDDEELDEDEEDEIILQDEQHSGNQVDEETDVDNNFDEHDHDEIYNDDNDDADDFSDDISDIDDEELMKRLEEKYGKLPPREYDSEEFEDSDDPSWTQIKPKPSSAGDGAQDIDDDFSTFEQELRQANDEMLRQHYPQAIDMYEKLLEKYANRPAVYLGKAMALDAYAEQKKSNHLLMEAIKTYKRYLAFDRQLTDHEEMKAAANKCIERLHFMGQYNQALAIHSQMLARFPKDPHLSNQLAVTYLILNRFLEAKRVLSDVLKQWPNDGFALVHYGFILKQYDLDYYNASIYLRRGIDSGANGTQDGRFYFQLGDALQRLNRRSEAKEIFRKGADLKLFPSLYQRSLYNEPNLRAQAFWTQVETGYKDFFHKLELNWRAIRAEAENLLSKSGYFLNETENLKSRGDWKQFELYARGLQRGKNCLKAPITCSLIEGFPAARNCRRGQVKFSVMHAGTHVWPHCGPTNCRLRAHLGLIIPPGTRLRVAEEERTWREGKFLIFDDSFEHEVWHDGSSLRLVLIVDVWHPDLSLQRRQRLSAI